MAGVPPKKGVAFSFDIPVFTSDGGYRTGATFSATQISKDGGAFASLTNAPVEVGTSGLYTISLTLTEMNADRIVIRLVPSTALTQVAGAEIFTDSAQIGELVRSTTPANTLDVSSTGEAGLDFNNVKDATAPHTLTNIRVPNVTLTDTTTNLTNPPTVPTVQQIVDGVWDELIASHLDVGSTGEALDDSATSSAPTVQEIDTQLSTTHGAGSWGDAAGSGFYTVQIPTEVSGLPADGVQVQVTNDIGGVNIVAQATSDTNGIATVFLDAGDYFAWLQRGGDTFPNPIPFTVPP